MAGQKSRGIIFRLFSKLSLTLTNVLAVSHGVLETPESLWNVWSRGVYGLLVEKVVPEVEENRWKRVFLGLLATFIVLQAPARVALFDQVKTTLNF